MSPKHATKGSYRPKEGRTFTKQVKVRLHDAEYEHLADLAADKNVTPTEWARKALRGVLRQDRDMREAILGNHWTDHLP